MLEAAAKAAGEWPSPEPFEHVLDRWNPLTDDGDALRLAVRLRIQIIVMSAIRVIVKAPETGLFEELHKDNPYAATRLAITRAAAEIGKAMP
jgi:hypothetical protein